MRNRFNIPISSDIYYDNSNNCIEQYNVIIYNIINKSRWIDRKAFGMYIKIVNNGKK